MRFAFYFLCIYIVFFTKRVISFVPSALTSKCSSFFLCVHKKFLSQLLMVQECFDLEIRLIGRKMFVRITRYSPPRFLGWSFLISHSLYPSKAHFVHKKHNSLLLRSYHRIYNSVCKPKVQEKTNFLLSLVVFFFSSPFLAALMTFIKCSSSSYFTEVSDLQVVVVIVLSMRENLNRLCYILSYSLCSSHFSLILKVGSAWIVCHAAFRWHLALLMQSSFMRWPLW